MAYIELVIKIDEDIYKARQHWVANPKRMVDEVDIAIANGTPLPKGHGRLKDIDKIINDGISKGFCDWYDEMKYADTIIEADRESEDNTRLHRSNVWTSEDSLYVEQGMLYD